MSKPLIPDIGVMAFVPDTWGDGVWQVRHQVLTRLSKFFNVVWADPPVGWRESIRKGPYKSQFVSPAVDGTPGLEIYRHSRWAGKFFKPNAIARLTDAARAWAGVQRLRERGCEFCIGYLWRPEFAIGLWEGNFDKRCYHIDDEYSFSVTEHPIEEMERQIIQRVDQVFIHSAALMEKKGSLNPNTLQVPNGVDYSSYSRPSELPSDMEAIDRPVVMYVGVLKSQLDWDLIETVARHCPHLSFVFVGPEGHLTPRDRQTLGVVQEMPNAHFLGSKPIESLAAYVRHADICIMPYKTDGYTKYIFPIKVNEYLAAGKPTIGTPIRSLQDYGAIVGQATTGAEWSSLLDKFLEDEFISKPAVDARRAVARKYDWNILVERIARVFCSLAGEQYVKQFDRLVGP